MNNETFKHFALEVPIHEVQSPFSKDLDTCFLCWTINSEVQMPTRMLNWNLFWLELVLRKVFILRRYRKYLQDELQVWLRWIRQSKINRIIWIIFEFSKKSIFSKLTSTLEAQPYQGWSFFKSCWRFSWLFMIS